MPDAIGGHGAYLSVAGNVISGSLIGLDGFDFADSEETNDVGGGGAMGTQGSGWVDATATYTVDENSTTLFHVTQNGKDVPIIYGREGNASGMPRLTCTGTLTVTHNFENRGKRRFSVSVEAHEDVARGTF